VVYNRAHFIKLFEDIGYRLVGQWERRNYQCAFPCIQSIRSKPTPECSSPLIEPLRPYFGNHRNGHNSSSGQDSNLQGGHNAKGGCCNEGGSDQRRDKHAGTAYSGSWLSTQAEHSVLAAA
jgi:hypothetical protein